MFGLYSLATVNVLLKTFFLFFLDFTTIGSFTASAFSAGAGANLFISIDVQAGQMWSTPKSTSPKLIVPHTIQELWYLTIFSIASLPS